ncbi:unnamed protein product, partial [Acanthoscelides obtectus]
MSGCFGNNKEFLSDFIDLHRQLPAVWKVKSDVYKNRNMKNLAYEKLVEKLKEVEPNADREMVRKKINVLRSAYRRELKKVIASYKSGTGTESIYEPSLWYFKELDFLRDQETQVPGTSTMNDPFYEIDNEDADSSQDRSSQGPNTPPGRHAAPESPTPPETDTAADTYTLSEMDVPVTPIQRRANKRKGSTEFEESQTRNEL